MNSCICMDELCDRSCEANIPPCGLIDSMRLMDNNLAAQKRLLEELDQAAKTYVHPSASSKTAPPDELVYEENSRFEYVLNSNEED